LDGFRLIRARFPLIQAANLPSWLFEFLDPARPADQHELVLRSFVHEGPAAGSAGVWCITHFGSIMNSQENAMIAGATIQQFTSLLDSAVRRMQSSHPSRQPSVSSPIPAQRAMSFGSMFNQNLL